MQLAMIGLGRMGGNMAQRLARDGHLVTAFDPSESARYRVAAHAGITALASLQEVIAALPAPRTIWLMVPHDLVDESIAALIEAGAGKDDLIVDGGNSNFKQSQRRGIELAEKGMHFVDCGTSGGVWGLENGYSLMVGGTDQAVERLAPALRSLAPAPDKGWGHVGPVGSGHYVKMVHNGIEYGMMQAFAEGFDLMASKEEFGLDMHQIASIWQHGSVVRSWLLDLTADALAQDKGLASLSDWMDDSGEGRWTIEDAISQAVPTPVLALALQMRFRSRQSPSFAGKIVNAMRAGFGGHPIKPADES